LHQQNKHQSGYDFKVLTQAVPELTPFVFENKFGTQTIDFADPKAVKILNTAILKVDYEIDYWEFPDAHLCPPIPGRVDYIHHLADLIKPYTFKNPVEVLDLGTGATAIYSLLGNAVYNWKFVATDVDAKALSNAKTIVDKNHLNDSIAFRLQSDASHILKIILTAKDVFMLSMCNPPFYKNELEAHQATTRKLDGLGINKNAGIRNFSGTTNELCYPGGEKAFLHTYLYESSLFKSNCFWFTSLVSNKDLVKSMQKSLKKLGATNIKVINMQLGNKVSRVVAWTFLNKDEQKDWLL
jgi:23S rRNA (adenine1618-N6)-methyltransferase